MYNISLTFFITGIFYFLAALAAGILLVTDQDVIPSLAALFWNMLIIGSVTQLIFGFGLRFFPESRKKTEKAENYFWGWLSYALLNTGLIFRLAGEPMVFYSENPVWYMLIVFSAIFQLISVVTFVVEMWPRFRQADN